MFAILLAAALPALGAITLVDLPAPRGGARVVRVCDVSGARTLWLAASGDTVAALGADFIPVAWRPDGAALRGYRLIEDGHDLVEARPEERRPGARPTPWADDPGVDFNRRLSGLAEALRRAAPQAPATALPICVDAGHGGPGAAQWNGVNGDGAGAHGPAGLTEQWVNLRVSAFLMQYLAADPRFAGSFRTRVAEMQLVTLADRVLLAAQGGAALFVSVHHNGLPAGTPNRTEAYYCRANPLCGSEAAWSRPARLLHDRVVGAFGYPGRGALEDSSGSGRFHFYVLRNSPCASALTEASNLNADPHEEDLFGRDPGEAHARAEALALYRGILEWAGYPTGVPEPAPAAAGLPAATLGAPRVITPTLLEFDWAVSGALVLEPRLFDVSGRLLRRWPPLTGPGRGVFRLDLAAEAGPAGAGLYWLALMGEGTVPVSRRFFRAR